VVTFYGTAMVDENGEVHFSEDIYGYDSMLEKALAKIRPTLNKDEISGLTISNSFSASVKPRVENIR
jgi:hypothetical protein